MYNYIKGIVDEIETDHITLSNNDIGYLIYTPNPYTFKIGETYKIYLYQYIREDEISLSKFDVYKELIETKSSEILCFNSISSLDSMVMDKDGKVVSVIKHERIK